MRKNTLRDKWFYLGEPPKLNILLSPLACMHCCAARWQGSSGASDYDDGGDIAGLGSNRDMLALKRQMEELGLQVRATTAPSN